jgi:predicted site-specific integrase-resolvase
LKNDIVESILNEVTMNVGYARVSSSSQSLENQIEQLIIVVFGMVFINTKANVEL